MLWDIKRIFTRINSSLDVIARHCRHRFGGAALQIEVVRGGGYLFVFLINHAAD